MAIKYWRARKCFWSLNWALLLGCCVSGVGAWEQPPTSSISIAVFEDHSVQLQMSSTYAGSWRLVEQAAQQQQLRLDPIATAWNSSINRLKEGKIDLVFAAFKTAERARWAKFSLPLLQDVTLLFGLKKNAHFRVQAPPLTPEIQNRSVGVIALSTQESLAVNLGFKHVYATRERQKLENLLISGRLDLVLVQGSFVLNCMVTGCENVVPMGPPFAGHNLRVMALKERADSSNIIRILDTGLRQAFAEGKAERLLRATDIAQPAIEQWQQQMLADLP